ncbi:hypothetical protein RRG08_000461 [Elysia crispata]|uniref:Uncharacterized protein n=1 Tax=Elysia crispata TaxID=231223 RepID=A0AAE0YCC2_9GAST|nr:hypothetical protein RRG08_000461 [Elysia crispata]
MPPYPRAERGRRKSIINTSSPDNLSHARVGDGESDTRKNAGYIGRGGDCAGVSSVACKVEGLIFQYEEGGGASGFLTCESRTALLHLLV